MMITLEEKAMRLSCNTFHAQVKLQILDLLHSNMVQLDCNCMVWSVNKIAELYSINHCHNIYLDSPSLCNDETVEYNQLDQMSVFPPTKI